MGETLEGLKQSLNNLAKQINATVDKRQQYFDRANEIKKIYDRMYQDKETIQSYKKSIDTFYRNSYNDFVGDNFKYIYKVEVKKLLEAYKVVIENIDANLDALNDEKLSYESLAADCLGPLGILESSYYTVKTKIQNWTN